MDFNMNTVNGQLNAVWDTQSNKTAFVFRDDDDEREVLTNKQVRNLSMKMASYLFSHGVRRGDVVCNTLFGCNEREIVNFGILLVGAVVMHGDVIDSKGRAFWAPIVQAKTRFIVVSEDQNGAWKMLKDDVGSSEADVEVLTRTPEAKDVFKVFKFRIGHLVKKVRARTFFSCFEIMADHPGTMNERVSAHDPAVILLHKDPAEKHYALVRRSHGEIVKVAQRVGEMLHAKAEDIIYNDYPLSWLPGLQYHYMTLSCTCIRSTLVNCPPRKIVADTWSLIEEEKCTMAALEPNLLQMLSSHCEDLPEEHHMLKVVTTTGKVRQSVMDAIGDCTHCVAVCYSKIETGLVACHLVDRHNKDVYAGGCVGHMTCNTQLAEETPIGEREKINEPATPVGEIMLNGELVVDEYFNDTSLTKTSFTKDGFFHTGDIGFYDEKKRLFVLGRKTDAIIRGNVPIFPMDIEEKVNQCPGIWKVSVVSIRDDNGVIQICACVIPRSDDTLTIEGVKEFCRYQLGGTASDDDNPHMPTYIFFFDSFPTVGGHVNRRLLAYMASEILHGNTRLT